MTRRSTFKKKIRERMKKTGERYAAARLALLEKGARLSAPPGAELVSGYDAIPGVHSDTALLATALRQAGVLDPATGEPFTEVKLYGLSGGIGFMYFLFEYAGHPPMMTFNCRTWTMPWQVVGKALEHAGIAHEVSETGGAKTAARKLDEALEAGRVAHLTVDFASLPWSGSRPEWVGQQPQQLNVVGRRGEAFVVDAGRLRELSSDAVAAARGAARKEKNRLVTFTGGPGAADPVDAVRSAAHHTARTFREAPFKNFAGNFGLAGLEKAAKLVGGTKDKKSWSRVFDSGPLAFLALYRTFECAMIELTPPAGGRPFYARYLDEAAALPGLASLADAAALARESGEQFEELARIAVEAGGNPLARALELTEEIDDLRRTSDDPDVGDTIRGLAEERGALADSLELSGQDRSRIFSELAASFEAIAATEQRLVEHLETV